MNQIQPIQGSNKNDFSDFTDDNIQKVLNGEFNDDTLSLSYMGKEKSPKPSNNQNPKSNKKKYEIIGKVDAAFKKGDYSQLSKIGRADNSGLSHSYDFFTSKNMTPVPGIQNDSRFSNNRYILKQGISKSDLSASFVKRPNKASFEGQSPHRLIHPERTPPPSFGVNNFNIMSHDNPSMSFKDHQGSQYQNANELSKSQSNLSQGRSSVSRIFQPTPQRLAPLDQ